MAVDIGNEATDRTACLETTVTLIEPHNPASKTGILSSVDLYACTTDMGGVKVAVFYRPDAGGNPNHFTSRGAHTIGTVVKDGKRTTTGISIPIQVGDYIGLYYSSGGFERDLAGDGSWYISGSDETGCVNTEFNWGDDRAYSMGGYITPSYQPRPSGMAVGVSLIF